MCALDDGCLLVVCIECWLLCQYFVENCDEGVDCKTKHIVSIYKMVVVIASFRCFQLLLPLIAAVVIMDHYFHGDGFDC